MTDTRSRRIGADVRRAVRGAVWEIGDEGYDAARTVWNGSVQQRPAAVARCADTDDVRSALDVAGRLGLPVSVRGGGYDWAGRAIRPGGLVIDLSALRGVEIDPVAAVAEIQGGALAGDLLAAAASHGLATAAGAVRGVGMVGMTMAGGYGGLIGRFGLALDNLLSAEVVLADGTVAHAGPDDDAELWWALRGGGGNFGVVTSARFRLHRLGPVLGGMVMYPHVQAGAVLRGYREIMAAAPDELTVLAGFLTGPGGAPVVFLAPTWSGDLADGEAAVAPLTRLGTPVMTALHPMPYVDLLRMFEAGSAPGNHNSLDTRWLAELTDDAIAALADGAAGRPSPMSLLMVHPFHGAAARVGPGETAFALRRPHLLIEVIGVWPPGGSAGPTLDWIDRTARALDHDALPGGYPNIVPPGGSDRVRQGFAGNLDRLLAAKRRYDPEGIFTAVAALG